MRQSSFDNDENSATSAEGRLRSREELRLSLEETLPLEAGVVYAFGYGSGVLSQQISAESGKSKSNNTTVDVIVVVRSAYEFHEANLRRNPHHYAWLSRSLSVCAFVQRHELPPNRYFCNPGLFFHLLDDHSMKYGIVQVEDLSRDLTDWSYLYLAGRMHKPTVTVLSDHNNHNGGKLLEHHHQENNLPAALAAALLLQYWHGEQQQRVSDIDDNNNTFRTVDIYQQIASLSYSGDPRVLFRAEDPAKISNLVFSPGQYNRFERLYRPAAERLQRQGILSADYDNNNNNHHHTWTWDVHNPLAHHQLWQSLPVNIRSQCGYDDADVSKNENLNVAVAAATAAAARLPRVLAAIVAPAARYQSIKGLWTAGLVQSAVYAYRKLSKGLLKRSR